MKKADKPSYIIIIGDKNKVSLGEMRSHRSAIVIAAFLVAVAVTVLAISYCCPELLAEFVRWIIGIAINS